MFEGIKAIVFDLDETLTNGYDPEIGSFVDIHFYSWLEAARELGIEMNEEIYSSKVRGKANYKIDALFDELYGREDGPAFSSIKEPIYIEKMIPSCWKGRTRLFKRSFPFC